MIIITFQYLQNTPALGPNELNGMCVCGFLKFIGLFFIASIAKVRDDVKSECPEASLPAENFTLPSSVTILLTLAKSWII